MRALIAGILLLAFIIAGQVQARAQTGGDAGWLVTARRDNGQSDLWALPADGGAWRPLTRTPDDERNPAFHPDGHTIIYEARRTRNWDVYALDLRTGTETRLTTDPHFDGFPAFSPDGSQIAFASMREGELDIFTLTLRGGVETNRTPTSPAHDFEPRWENNNTLLFVSTRNRNHDLFRLRLGQSEPTPVTETPDINERGAQSLPDGILLITAQNRTRELQQVTRAGDPVGAPFSWTGSVLSAALNPTGETVAWLEKRYDGIMLYRRALAEDAPTVELSGAIPFMEGLAWGNPDSDWMEARLGDAPALTLTPTPQPRPSELLWIEDLDTLQPELNRHVVTPFSTLRGRIAGELGYDFLGELSESVRPVDWESEESDYLSWHKSGRAFDTLLDTGYRFGFANLELVRQDQHGEIYWDFWLRCPVQDGTCGEPLVNAPWDFSYEARWEVAPGQGGVPKSFMPGYYVPFTRYAEDAGWERITAYETPAFDWRQNNIAAEFWHYQYTGGLKWYQGMQEILSPAELDEYFNWRILREQAIPLWNLRTKGIPLPTELRNLPAELIVP